MKRKAIIPLLLGLGVGLATVKLLVDTIRKAQASGANKQTVSAVVAKQDINAAQEITPEMVLLIETADSLLTPASERIESLDDVVGRVAAKSIPQQAAVLKGMLAPAGTRPGMQGQIPPGFRAVSVKIDEASSVGYQLQPGDWVDVIVVMDVDSMVRGKKETIAEVILQHVQVAAFGHSTDNLPASANGGKMQPAKSATLLVRDSDAPKLHLAGTRGKITLAMRGDDVELTERPASAQMTDILPGHLGGRTAGSGADGGSPWLEAFKMFAAGNPDAQPPVAPKEAPDEVDARPPFTVLVSRGIAGANTPMAVEQITFQDAESMKIVNVQYGPPTRSQATLDQTEPVQPARRQVSPASLND